MDHGKKILFPHQPDGLKIISGGQSGVDRAALDIALELGLPCSGWCPKGRRCEDGLIDVKYPLLETDSRRYAERTELNILHSDATLILNEGKLSGGTLLTFNFLKKHNSRHPEEAKAVLLLQMDKVAYSQADLLQTGKENYAAEEIIAWIKGKKLENAILNIAGPKESKRPGVEKRAAILLRNALAFFANNF